MKRLFADGWSRTAIARHLNTTTEAVARALTPGARDRYWRASRFERYVQEVDSILALGPKLTVLEIAACIEWPGSRRSLSTLVAQLRPKHLEGERASLTALDTRPAAAGRVGRIGSVSEKGVAHGEQAPVEAGNASMGASDFFDF